MKILIGLVTDSDNNYPEVDSIELELEGNGKWVTLRLTSPDRKVNVLRKDLEQAVGALT